MTSNDEERPDETRVRPVSDDEPWTPEADAEPDDIQPIDIRARQRKVVAIGLGCVLAVACGLGAAAWAMRPAAQPAEGNPVAEEPARQDASVPQLLSGLSYHGRDVSATPSAVTVTAASGHVMVEERSDADAATRVDLSARRSAALAHELSGQTVRGDEVADVTWVACDPDGAVKFAVKNDVSSEAANAAEPGAAASEDGAPTATPSDEAKDAPKPDDGDTSDKEAPAVDQSGPSDGGEAKADEPTTSEVVSGSTGWTMSGDTKDGLADVAPDLPQQGGEAPTTPDGAEIAPEQPAPVEPSEEIPAEGGEGAGSGDPGQASQPASGGGSGTASGSAPSTPSTPAGGGSSGSGSSGAPSTPAHQHDWQPVYGTRWVQDSAAWDETVVVSGAWDETVPVYGTVGKYVCRCGAQFDSIDAWETHNDSSHDSEYSYGYRQVQIQTGTTTKHHDAVTKIVHHDASGHNESYVTGYRCSGCGATR